MPLAWCLMVSEPHPQLEGYSYVNLVLMQTLGGKRTSDNDRARRVVTFCEKLSSGGAQRRTGVSGELRS